MNVELGEQDKGNREKTVTLKDDDGAGVWGGGRLNEKGQREASALSKFNCIQTRDLRSDRFGRGSWITRQAAQTRVVARFNASAGRSM